MSNPNFNRTANFRHIGAARTSAIATENRFLIKRDNSFANIYTVLELRTVFYFLLGGRAVESKLIFSNKEWSKLYKNQIDSGSYSHIPYMVRTAAYLNMIIPTVSARKRALFDRYKLDQTKSVKADNPVRQASRANATSEDHNFYLEVRFLSYLLPIFFIYIVIHFFPLNF